MTFQIHLRGKSAPSALFEVIQAHQARFSKSYKRTKRAFGGRAKRTKRAFGGRAKRTKRIRDFMARVEHPFCILARHHNDDRRPHWSSSRTRRVAGPPAHDVARRVGESIPRPRRFPPRALCVSPVSQPASSHPSSTVSFPGSSRPSAFQRRDCSSAPSRAVSPAGRSATVLLASFASMARRWHTAPSFRGIRNRPDPLWQASSTPDQTCPEVSKSVRRAHTNVHRSLHYGTCFASRYVLEHVIFNSILTQASRGTETYRRQPAWKRAVSGTSARLSRALPRTRHLPILQAQSASPTWQTGTRVDNVVDFVDLSPPRSASGTAATKYGSR